jgi:ABC-type glycerol-3-phosphate transport system permease component
MLHFLPAPLRGAIALLLYAFNTIGCFITMLPFIFLKVIVFNEKQEIFLQRVSWCSVRHGSD